ncbi:RluA family pseudouridine synthase [Thiomicrorhabdus heinhorstiae]|uniref:Pseudouridine synthase n=1 Tax=Thiomicrorhabdus heinhorstiae TaxID=2748010 RepID=A0ABS0BTU5_9GAMM|nr:RluA family pseudouridine synthase [Thiomicrorhabdus heinhorstiae]MBF6057270.1 RluA family pseudouridine synthase [Thiomicrorhabdus heinhorstiae]
MHPQNQPIQLRHFDFDPQWVLYADEHLLVVNKPSGLLSVPGRGADKQLCLQSLLDEHYPQVRIVHRLDMDTSGLMVLAMNAEAHRQLSRQFQDRQISKTYLAVCSGKPSQLQGRIGLPMRCDWERRPLQMIDFRFGKSALTYWQVLHMHRDRFLILLTPITGRSHQLRLHMKMLGHPILGDNLYADRHSLQQTERLMLHAHSLSFRHPVSGSLMHFQCPPDWEH